MSGTAADGRPLRLLLIYETLYPDYAGGIESRNFELARALGERGHAVTLAGFGRDDDATAPRMTPPGVSRLALGAPRGLYNRAGRRSHRRSFGYALRAARISPSGYDLVETPNMPFAQLPAIALRCRAAGVPLLVVWYEVWGAHWRQYVGRGLAPLYRSIERRAARLGTRVAAPSELVRGRLARLRRSDPVALAPCGVDLARVRAAAADAPPGPPLVAAGRLLTHKRVEVLLDAVSLLAALSPGEPLVAIYGDGPEREHLAARAAALGIAHRVVFHGQVPTVEEVWRGFGAARLAVHCSEREGFGLVPLEAMAAGLPVVFSRSGESAVAELVRHEIEGIETEPNAEALAAAIRALLADEPRRLGLAAAARRRAEGYRWSAIAAEYERLLQEVASRARGRRQRLEAPGVASER